MNSFHREVFRSPILLLHSDVQHVVRAGAVSTGRLGGYAGDLYDIAYAKAMLQAALIVERTG